MKDRTNNLSKLTRLTGAKIEIYSLWQSRNTFCGVLSTEPQEKRKNPTLWRWEWWHWKCYLHHIQLLYACESCSLLNWPCVMWESFSVIEEGWDWVKILSSRKVKASKWREVHHLSANNHQGTTEANWKFRLRGPTWVSTRLQKISWCLLCQVIYHIVFCPFYHCEICLICEKGVKNCTRKREDF